MFLTESPIRDGQNKKQQHCIVCFEFEVVDPQAQPSDQALPLETPEALFELVVIGDLHKKDLDMYNQ